MEELATKYDPRAVEDKWYAYWMQHRLFHSEPDAREPYTIVIPPPNVTGILHMGHMLNNTIQDILIRRARLMGKNALWVPGTDHAAIATEAKVVGKLAAEGIKKSDLTREEFLAHAWEWKEKHGGIILEQLKKLGASCDWERTAFTMDDIRSRSVIKVFVDLYRKGLIYRGKRMVNWDPKAKTALSDIEVVYKEEHSKLYYLRYKIVGEEGYAIVATTRPETIMGDTAMCINPNDPKNQHLRGKRVIVPLVGREIPVIEDDYVEIDFGTGCLKVTPAHDMNDNMLGEKHNLETIDIFNDDATISEAAGMYIGMDRFAVREQIAKDLAEAGLIEKIEDYENKVGYSERNPDTATEPRLSDQWFLRMESLAAPALKASEDGVIRFVPEKFKTTYNRWMTEIRDWCISRQLWWGHRVPAWYLPGSETFVVAETADEALTLAREINPDLTADDLRQDEDCLDTWFSSWLWPISLFNGILEPDNEEIRYYYPTSDLVTGPDIIFFWVARMIMAGYEFLGKQPFNNIYFTGIVRDEIGRKMSKQFGNSPDPLELIADYGADGVRMGIMLAAPAGNDIFFDKKLCENGRNFCNKIWNAFRLVKGWEVDPAIEQPESSRKAVEWFSAKLSEAIAEINDSFEKFRISEALMTAYRLFRDEFSSWYLEMVKPDYQKPIDRAGYEATISFFDSLLRLLHPFMPFITEELWQHLATRREGESIMYASMPQASAPDTAILADMETVKEIINGIRGVRAQRNIPSRDTLQLNVIGADIPMQAVAIRLGNLSGIATVSEKDPAAASFMVGTTEFNIPLLNNMDVEAELAKLTKELDYLRGFKTSVEKKLSNERFVSNAPAAVVEAERKKLSDATTKIEAIEQTIAALKA